MDRHERHTRKPRLFRPNAYPHAGLAALLLLSGTQLPGVAVAAPAARHVSHDGMRADEATPDCGIVAPASAAGTATHLLETHGNTAHTGPAESRQDNRLGWAFALLLAGIAIGRRAAPVATEAP